MTIFGIIDPHLRRQGLSRYDDANAAMRAAGLEPGCVDFGTIWSKAGCGSVSIIVHETGLLGPVDAMAYFSIGGELYAGGAVLFAADRDGETVDMPRMPPVTWFQNARAAEMAINRGEVRRPVMAVNGEVLWSWPQDGGEQAMRRAARSAFDGSADTVTIDDITIVRLK